VVLHLSRDVSDNESWGGRCEQLQDASRRRNAHAGGKESYTNHRLCDVDGTIGLSRKRVLPVNLSPACQFASRYCKNHVRLW
jgi:hypothetical protein